MKLVKCNIFFPQIPGDIEQVCTEKEIKMSRMNLTMQLFIIVVGPEITSIEKVYVRMDKTMYKVPSVLKALDTLFKIFMIFNACYPKESENFWYLVQWGIFEIHTVSDENIPFVRNALNKLQRS